MRALIIVLIGLAFAAPASADVYTVSGVVVDTTAASAADARDRAVAEAQLVAAGRLIDRLTLPEDRISMPALDESTASLLVSGFQVDEEAASGTRWIGRLSVNFDPSQVRGFLRGAGIPFVESQTRPMVVVPLWRGGGGVTLWGDTAWRRAWSEAALENALAPIIAPSGDLDDISAINASAAARLDAGALGRLAALYGVDSVLVATGESTGSGVVGHFVQIDLADGARSTDIGRFSSATAASVIDQGSERLQTAWKRNAIVRGDQVAALPVTVLFSGVSEWTRLRSAIGGASLITDARLDALSASGAMMTLRHRGRPEQLISELRERGVALAQEPIGWTARSGRR